ncbi:unnamed protein product [Nippostrongylus brasiliensis]|uniref:CW domain-containing protein n=1 Tax=Nippostrongylus brasiliensis TaxID=27835 RepID=A0A0N4YIK8_NIPBR|nr:unnamed protein product [Nippostrongylus brasiliensis]
MHSFTVRAWPFNLKIGVVALSYVEIEAQNFRGQLRFETYGEPLEGCLRNCYLLNDCTIAVYIDTLPEGGGAYEIRRDATYTECNPKFTFPTLIPFTRPNETDGITTATQCDVSKVIVYVNTHGVHFHAFEDQEIKIMKDLTPMCSIFFIKDELPGCSSIPVYQLQRRRRLLFGEKYGASFLYLKYHAYTSSATCTSSTPSCERSVILREYKNTTMEDYVYLPEGTVHPQLEYTEVNIPIHVHYTNCSLATLQMS